MRREISFPQQQQEQPPSIPSMMGTCGGAERGNVAESLSSKRHELPHLFLQVELRVYCITCRAINLFGSRFHTLYVLDSTAAVAAAAAYGCLSSN